jgi:hypothetical protein
VTQWFYAADGVQHGPVSEEALKALVVDGRLGADDLVWNPALPQWTQARSALSQTMAPPFFSVGIVKLVVMLFGTMWLYQLYWMYKQWDAIRDRTGEDMMPVARSIFAIFFFHKLAGEVNDVERGRGRDLLPAGALAGLFVVLSLTWRLPDPGWLISFLTILPMAILQKRMNDVNSQMAPLADRNRRIRAWNWLAVFLGIPFIILVLLGTFFPD